MVVITTKNYILKEERDGNGRIFVAFAGMSKMILKELFRMPCQKECVLFISKRMWRSTTHNINSLCEIPHFIIPAAVVFLNETHQKFMHPYISPPFISIRMTWNLSLPFFFSSILLKVAWFSAISSAYLMRCGFKVWE